MDSLDTVLGNIKRECKKRGAVGVAVSRNSSDDSIVNSNSVWVSIPNAGLKLVGVVSDIDATVVKQLWCI